MIVQAATEPSQSRKVSYTPGGKASVRQRLYEKLHKPTQINSHVFALAGESAVVVSEFKPNSYDFVFRWRNQNVQVLIQANELRDDSGLYVYVGSLSKSDLPYGFDLVRDGVAVDESDPGKLLIGLAGLAHDVAVEYKTKRAEAAAEPALVHQSPNVLFLILTDEIQNRNDPIRTEISGYHVTVSGRNDDGMRTYPVITLKSEKWDKGFPYFNAYINQSKSVRGTYPALFDYVNGRKIVGDIHHGVNTPRALLKNAIKLAIKAAEAAHRSWLRYSTKAKKLNATKAAAEPQAPYNNVPGIYYVSNTLESDGTSGLYNNAQRVRQILNKHKFFPRKVDLDVSSEHDIDGVFYRRVNFEEIKYTGSNISKDARRLVHELDDNDSRLGIKFIDIENFVDDYSSADADDVVALGSAEPIPASAHLAFVVYSDHTDASSLHKALALPFVTSVSEMHFADSRYSHVSESMFRVELRVSSLNDLAKFVRVLAETPRVVALCDNPTSKPVLVTDADAYKTYAQKFISILHQQGIHAT